VITWANPPDIPYGVLLGAAQLNATANVPGTFSYSPPAGTLLNAGLNQPLTATFTPSDAANFISTSKSVSLNVNKSAPVITWSNPADMIYGVPLGVAQLNASANVPGAFSYTPAAGAILNAGANQSLSVTFTPADSANILSATKSVPINVNKSTPVITWANPADISYGGPLGILQLHATANVPGTFSYSPPAGTILNAGLNQPLSVTFTPNDTANLLATAKSVTINVNKATPIITWSNPADITVGTLLSSVQLNATANVPGTFSYAPAFGAVLSAGPNQSLSTTFTPADLANIDVASKSVTINVSKALPVISWNNPADITYGTPLSPVQLNATANIPGSFSYSPSLGTVLHAGNSQPLTVTFTPNDTANYGTAVATANINVTKATPVINWSPLDMTIGFPVGAGQMNATANVPGSFSYSPGAGVVLGLGDNQPLTATFTPNDLQNYISVTKTVNIDVVEFRIYISGNGNNVRVQWGNGPIELQEADTANGPWRTTSGNPIPPYNLIPPGHSRFFRLHR